MFKEKFVWVVDLYDNPMLFLWSRKFSIRYLMLKVFTFFLERIRILKKLDIAILVGKRDGKLFKLATESYGVPPKKIYCTTNGVDLEMFRPQTIGKRDAQFKLVFVGEVLRYHGLESWLNAVVYLKKMIPEIKLILIGYSNFNDLSWLNIAIKDQEIEGHVEFLGVLPSSQIPSFLAQADVCLCVFSKKLGLEDLHPIKLYEYLAMNKAVIASDVEGIRGIIKDGENGLLVPPDNPQALAKAAYHLYKNPIFKAELEKHARTSILEFDWKIVNRKILDEIKHRVCREGACQ